MRQTNYVNTDVLQQASSHLPVRPSLASCDGLQSVLGSSHCANARNNKHSKLSRGQN